MPNWREVLEEIQQAHNNNPNDNPLDTVRRKYLRKVFEQTGRNTIAYYSGWLQKPGAPDTIVNDKDKSGFMLAIHKLDKTKGLDLILHTPGGDIAATESLVDYLYSVFGKDIRANPQAASLWQVIIGKYHPTLLGSCRQAIEWSEKMVQEWLEYNMCSSDKGKVKQILKTFADHRKQKSHARHISKKECEEVGLNITSLEKDHDLQDSVLTTHHAFLHTFSHTPAVKIIENHSGVAYVEESVPQQ